MRVADISTRILAVVLGVLALGCDKVESDRPIHIVVMPGTTIVAGEHVARHLDDAVVASIRNRADVISAHPRLPLLGAVAVPFGAAGDGIPTQLVADDPALAALFIENAWPVPMLVSPYSIERFNYIAERRGAPKFDNARVQRLIANNTVFRITVGGRRVDAVLVGVSSYAAPSGVSFPIGDVTRWNGEQSDPHAVACLATDYIGVEVTLRDARRLHGFEKWLAKELGLHVRDDIAASRAADHRCATWLARLRGGC
jgi:hypothetical protein